MNNDFKLYFVDVGQGDCSVIITPLKKVVIIDGGEGNSDKYDYGENVVLPYLLDRKIGTIDYMIISHFDSDHVGGLISIMGKIRIKSAIISMQSEDSQNFQDFLKLAKDNNIKINIVKMGDRVQIDETTYFDILWPKENEMIQENGLNNNSVVCKLHYKKFSMLFTGDIEKIAEDKIMIEYKDKLQLLESVGLKAGHHGSNTSSTQEFLNAIKPHIVLIGVGKNNNFGHPSAEVLNRYLDMRSKSI